MLSNVPTFSSSLHVQMAAEVSVTVCLPCGRKEGDSNDVKLREGRGKAT